MTKTNYFVPGRTDGQTYGQTNRQKLSDRLNSHLDCFCHDLTKGDNYDQAGGGIQKWDMSQTSEK